MPQPQRVTIEQIVTAYRETGSVWKAGKRLGIVGQSVWERLKAVDCPMHRRKWDDEELSELRSLADNCTIGDIAKRLGRPYYAVAIKLSRLGIASRYGNRVRTKRIRGSGFNKETIAQITKAIAVHPGSLRNFCRMNGYDLETMVAAIQKYDMPFWAQYAAAHSELTESHCPYCGATFYPMTAKQKTCSRKCSEDARRDEQYFGGKRRNTIGLAEGICQLCGQKKDHGLSAHHVLGKENDPENECLVALCRGCHHLVGVLAGRRFVDSNEGWENLITLVMGRRMADKNADYAGASVCVEFEYLTSEELFDNGALD